MLSNKLTFSLVFVVMLAVGLIFVATPANAQKTYVSQEIGGDTTATAANSTRNTFPKANGFAIFEMPLTPSVAAIEGANGIVAEAGTDSGTFVVPAAAGARSATNTPIITAVATADRTTATTIGGVEVEDSRFPNLYDILRDGGTIELAVSTTGVKAGKSYAHRFVMTEVMWGENQSVTGDARAMPQWIEVYNNFTLADAERVVDDPLTVAVEGPDNGAEPPVNNAKMLFIFTENNRIDRVGTSVVYDPNSATDTTGDEDTYYIVDMISTTARFGSNWSDSIPGNSGSLPVDAQADGTGAGITADKALEFEPTRLVSMYRKHDFADGSLQRQYKANAWNDGSSLGSWGASSGRINITGYFTGTPGSVHRPPIGTEIDYAKAPAALPATSVIINEVRNDIADANLDWIELHNTGATDVAIKKWTIDMVINNDSDAAKNHKRVVEFPDAGYAMIPAGGFLVIYNRDPEDTILADGIDISDPANEKVQKGAQHLYFVDPDLNLNDTGKFLLVLRNGNDKFNHEKIVDIAGNGFFAVTDKTRVDQTDVFPLRGWTVPGDRDDGGDFGGANTFASANSSFGRDAQKSRANRLHKDDWKSFAHQGGTGYDQRVDLAVAPGTPGYANNAVKGKAADLTSGMVSISEVMYDAGPRWNLVQWIELYNSSMTESANLQGWQLEIRNKEDVDSYVDAIFTFEDGAIILPNQTLLLVSGSAQNNVARNRVYNLYQRHRTELGLEPAGRRSRLLSRTGFLLRLWDKDANPQTGVPVDIAGNVELNRADRKVAWALPDRDDVRQSLVRQYGTRAIDRSADAANDGMMESSWMQSDVGGAGISFYGHRDDASTPGYRLGGPLPVSLSSFRPVRDKATGEVVIRWITQSELNNAGFNILRAKSKTGEFTVVNVKGIVPGHGTTSEKHVYTWTDTTAKPNVVYYYQIEDVSLNGNRTTLTTTRLKGHVSAAGKVTTTWGNLKDVD